MEINIYVASLADYNAGRLVGEWITLNNKTYNEVMQEIQDMLKGSEEEIAEEWAIHDYESPFAISECESIRELMDIVAAYDDCEADEAAKDAAAKIFDKGDLEKIYNDFWEYYCGQYNSLEDYAEEIAIDHGYLDNKDNNPLFNYIDWSRFARDLKFDGYKEVDGYIFRQW